MGAPPDSDGARGGSGGGSGGTDGRGGASGRDGASGSSGSAETGGSGGTSGTQGGDASAGTAGTARATGGSAGSATTGGTAGTADGGGTAGTSGAGRGGTGGTGGSAGRGGTTGTGGTAGTGGTTGAGGTGGAPPDAGPMNWCATQARPAGVAAADYQCLDFENGLPPVGTWPTTIYESGSRLITTTRASSLPQSLLTSVGAATSTSSQQISLQWHSVGSTFASSVSITADINPLNFVGVAPPWSGSIALLCASFGSFGSSGSGDACFSYTRGGDLSFANDYVGYFIEHTGGPGFRYHCALTGNLASNLWSRVELRLTRSPGTVQVFVNGTSVGATCSPIFLDDTVTTDVSFGMRAHPETQAWNVYFDNVVAAVRR